MSSRIIFVLLFFMLFSSASYAQDTIKVRAYTKGKITSSGTKPIKNITLAVSRDLLRKYYGKQVIIRDASTGRKIGEFVVTDKMKRTHKKAADIYMGRGNKRKAKKFGVVSAIIIAKK